MVVINKFSSHCGDFSSNVLDHWFHEILMFSYLQKHSDVLNIFYDDDIVELLWGKKYNTALRRYKEPGLAR